MFKHYFWVCLWGCFWKRLALESEDWVKITLTSAGWILFNFLKAWVKQKVRRRPNLLSAWAQTCIFFCPQTLALWFLGFLCPFHIEKREKNKGLEKKIIYGYSGNSHFNQISNLELFTSRFSVPFVYKIKWTYNNLQVWSQHPPASPFLPPSWIPPPSFLIGQPLPMPWPCLPGKAQSSFKNLLKGHTLS